MKNRMGRLQPLHRAKMIALVIRLRPDIAIDTKGTAKVVSRRTLPPMVPRFSTGTMRAKCARSEGRPIPIKKPIVATEKMPKEMDIVDRGNDKEEMTLRMVHATKKRCLLTLLRTAAPTIIETMMDAG